MTEETLEQVGRIAFRIEGDWWVAYYALPDTMDKAIELARVQIAIVTNHPQRRSAFMKLIQSYIRDAVPAFRTAETITAPEHERAGRG